MACECGCGQETPRATRNRPGYLKGDPLRFIPEHRNRTVPPHREEDRGYETPCWIWLGYVMPDGYGRCRRDGAKVLAHVAAYEEAVGPVPEGHELDHLCRVRCCVRPDHLEPVSHAENGRRGAAAKLVAEQVRAIRGRLSRGARQAEVAGEFGVAVSTVGAIASGRLWRGV